MSGTATIAVLAKAPIPGRVKTRLCPPCTPGQAAVLARAALEDTLEAAAAVPRTRLVLVLDGDRPAWVGTGLTVIPQRGQGLDERLAAAFDDLGGPVLLVGMDTPQVTAAQLEEAISSLAGDGTDAVLGLAPDGGYWAVGLRVPDAGAFLGVPMSTAGTGAAQEQTLHDRGRSVVRLPELRDVDEWPDAVAVAAAAPSTRFARAVAAVMADLRPVAASG